MTLTCFGLDWDTGRRSSTDYTNGSESVVTGPVAFASPENFLETHVIVSCPKFSSFPVKIVNQKQKSGEILETVILKDYKSGCP